jgi:hypothetical protein
MSVNMIAAKRRVSAGFVLALSSAMVAIIGYVACDCQTVLAWLSLVPECLKE